MVRSLRVGSVTVPPGASVPLPFGPSTVTADPESSVTVVRLAPIATVNSRPR